MASIEELKALSILKVAESLGMSLQRTGSYTYTWEEHDSFTINVRENYFNWFARSNGGDVIKMVQVVQEELTGEKLSFKQAKHFLEEGSFDVVDVTNVPEKEPFSYYLEPYETKFIEAREYLKDVRGLSDETIDFFVEKNVLSQATKKTGDYYEPVIVFKSLDNQGEVIGASLQGIKENHDLYERGRLKQIMRASDGMTGMHVDIGTPKRLVFAEAPIDLMSYYELHKDSLEDVRLVAMDGLKESTVSRHVAELLSEVGELDDEVDQEKKSSFLAKTAKLSTFFKDGKHQDLITLAVDNDEAGHAFIERLTNKEIGLTPDLPPRLESQDKMDWNDYLKESKEKALDRSQEPLNNIGGELINRNSGYLEGEPSRTAPQPEESKTQPDFPANVQLYFNIDRSKESSVGLRNGYHYATDKDFEPFKDEPNLQNGGLAMADNNEPNLRNRFEQILREDEEKKQAEARKEELERDSDGDGIPDEVEKAQGTSPFNADTDGDGKSDQEEVSYGSNPIDSNHPNNQNQPSPEPQKSVAELIQAKDSKGLSQLLKDGVKDYFQSDTYKQYLTTMSKFHNYSPRNIQLILMQNPEASHVASFKKWKDEFERSVNKGEKSLRIFAPITLKRRDPKTNEPLLDENGNEQTFMSFKLVPVFDVSQTNGKELPKQVYELEGTYEDYGNLYKSAKEVSEANGVPLSFSKDTKGSNGFYSVNNNEIVIKQGMSEQQTLKTIFHEMAHSDLHNMEKLQETPLKRSTAELQAESVAFVVASHYGLDTSEYSFGYLATWTDDPNGLSDLEGQIKIVQKEADSLISRIDKTLEKYQTKELTKDAFQEKLDRLKNQSKEKAVDTKKKEQAKDAPKKEQKSDNEMSL